MNKEQPWWVNVVCAVAVLGFVGVVWQGVIWAQDIPAYSVPTPAMTMQALIDDFPIIAGRCALTLRDAAAGLVVSTVLAMVLAVLVSRWTVLTRPITGYALIIRTLPIVGVAPLVTLVAGRGVMATVICVVIVTVFTLFVAILESMRALPPAVTDLSVLYDTGFVRKTAYAWVPAAVGGIVMGLRISGPMAIVAAILAEWLSGHDGIGSLMTTAQANREVTMLWAATVAAAVVGLIAYMMPGALVGLARRFGFVMEVSAG
ncbi:MULTISPECIES: ABC transporter permease [Gordonia]|uniref:Putative ABC transporter permease protein n=1 Tax=Gordonia alkanivorans NBRC 16433 TaxID=1027371 RepID=F9VRX5_9ACTN|nr:MULTISPECIES: ABC transporter permease subunit [Gordonia]MDH3020529.1 ABC transporter permease subunit [Gordonia alkanivorans]MDH3049392.1 ABC transporter permease subunit [Gordonia alkanivorans]MDJ0007295.1 ABC transporter permease subunit [Gordonia alkanivorans]MDJ0027688.1 ABC transporter permease subunit [Gordonia alkanivorans]MDJ0098392.1 ABC transporter permease subunit [Gordonia alkanivorans]